ncbi:hypothetical protein F8388_007697 [Cannabis sativa]|uniref:Protein kinase domain-containing protein n=1 Tax=Cannabis sativa TaxID=3483 RepID=A0A7J6FSS9_CANSA|nr:hypothetical protein F8388_007697 [Cannabis sativa]
MGLCLGKSGGDPSPSTNFASTSPGTSSNYSKNIVLSGTTNSSSVGKSQFSEAASGSVDESFLNGQFLESPNLRVFSFAELKACTKNFKADSVLGEGGFGKVFKGWVDEKTLAPSKVGTGMMVAIKKLNSESMQGFQEWQNSSDVDKGPTYMTFSEFGKDSEVNFLGRLSHPNLVKLLGYCWEDKELLLVYEKEAWRTIFLEVQFRRANKKTRNPSVEPLSWERRLQIAIGAARGLAFLHASDKKVIYRDFKASNILLDGLGPSGGDSHVTTRIMGTYGYAAPEYIATGHLYVKSDVYGYGVVLLELLTGLRALDSRRPSGQHNLVDWSKPCLSSKRKLNTIMDVRMEGQYLPKAAFQAAQLTLKCLEQEPKHRPSMKDVLESLEKIEAMKVKAKQSKGSSRHSSTTSTGSGRLPGAS